MPTYEFECPVCGERYEVVRKIKDRNDPVICHTCKERCERVVELPAPVQFEREYRMIGLPGMPMVRSYAEAKALAKKYGQELGDRSDLLREGERQLNYKERVKEKKKKDWQEIKERVARRLSNGS